MYFNHFILFPINPTANNYTFAVKGLLLVVCRADADGDGLITKEEWFEVLTKAGKKVTRWVDEKGRGCAFCEPRQMLDVNGIINSFNIGRLFG